MHREYFNLTIYTETKVDQTHSRAPVKESSVARNKAHQSRHTHTTYVEKTVNKLTPSTLEEIM